MKSKSKKNSQLTFRIGKVRGDLWRHVCYLTYYENGRRLRISKVDRTLQALLQAFMSSKLFPVNQSLRCEPVLRGSLKRPARFRCSRSQISWPNPVGRKTSNRSVCCSARQAERCKPAYNRLVCRANSLAKSTGCC